MSSSSRSGHGRDRTILLTGASGFVGGRLHDVLCASGYRVRCLTRRAEEARARFPRREWAEGDVSEGAGLDEALVGCQAAFYLVHGMAGGLRGHDLVQAEVGAATYFADAAARRKVGRIVYLGGVMPEGPPSAHLLSRLEVGRALRHGKVPVTELRASMIVGHGSLSWLVVRDLAARLPVMILPRWLRSRTEPVAIDDVVVALSAALENSEHETACFDIPGPEIMTGRAILERTARMLGHAEPTILEVPVLSPWLSSLWVRLITRAEWRVAREVVVGLDQDLLAKGAQYWRKIGHYGRRLSFDEAVRRALREEAEQGRIPGGGWGKIEHWLESRA